MKISGMLLFIKLKKLLKRFYPGVGIPAKIVIFNNNCSRVPFSLVTVVRSYVHYNCAVEIKIPFSNKAVSLISRLWPDFICLTLNAPIATKVVCFSHLLNA